MTPNYQQTTPNDQIDLFQIPIIYFFKKILEMRHLTLLCNIKYILYVSHDINLSLFLIKASRELEPH